MHRVKTVILLDFHVHAFTRVFLESSQALISTLSVVLIQLPPPILSSPPSFKFSPPGRFLPFSLYLIPATVQISPQPRGELLSIRLTRCAALDTAHTSHPSHTRSVQVSMQSMKPMTIFRAQQWQSSLL